MKKQEKTESRWCDTGGFGPVHTEKEIKERINEVNELLNDESREDKEALRFYMESLIDAKNEYHNIN